MDMVAGIRRLFSVVVPCALFCTVGAISWAEQLTTLAVVNVRKIYNSFYSDANTARAIDSLRRRYQIEIDTLQENITQLEERRARMLESGASERELQELDRNRSDLLLQVDRLRRQRERQIDERRRSQVPEDFLRSLQQAIVYVAESEGYTIVLRTDTVGIQWWSPVVDITESVSGRLEQIFGR